MSHFFISAAKTTPRALQGRILSVLRLGVPLLACSLGVLFLFVTPPDLPAQQPTLRAKSLAVTALPTTTGVIAPTEPRLVPVTPSPAPTATGSLLAAALTAARNFTGSNADWQALYPDGFIYMFEDAVPMVLVPAGCFMMGSTRGDADERPVHEQCFTEPFWIDLTEVTQADFERLGGTRANADEFAGAQRPVESISWLEARDFCALRAARLPTEREWEYAARGPAGWEYPWGEAWNANHAVWNRPSPRSTAHVGTLPAGRSWVGAFDLSGNVWEWTSSLYERYPYADDHEDSRDTDSARVLRGGSYLFPAVNLRAANRHWDNPVVGYSLSGFRCARTEQP